VPALQRTIRIPITIRCVAIDALDGDKFGTGLESAMIVVFRELSSRLALNPPLPTLVLQAAKLVGEGAEAGDAMPLLARVDSTIERVAAQYLPTARQSLLAAQRTLAPSALAAPPPPPQTTGEWLDVDSHEQAVQEYRKAEQRGEIVTPSSRYQGVLYRIRGAVGVTVLRFPTRELILQGEFENVYRYGLGPDNKPARIALELSSSLDYEINFYCQREGQARTRASIARFFEPASREILTPRRKQFGDRFNVAVQVGSELLGDAYLKDQADKVAFAVIKAGNQPVIAGLPVSIPNDLSADLIVLKPVTGLQATVEVDVAIQVPGGEAGRPDIAQCEDAVEPELAAGTTRVTYSCEPFCGEPSVFKLGSWGLKIFRQIELIAKELGLEPCPYAGQFTLVAASAIGLHALRVARRPTEELGQTRATPAGEGNLGTLDLNFVESQQIQDLRRLAAVVPKMSILYSDVQHYMEFLGGAWGYDFVQKFNERFQGSIRLIFKMACQVIFLQLLNASRRAIEDRQNDDYGKRFQIAILPQLMSIYELEMLVDMIHFQQMSDDQEGGWTFEEYGGGLTSPDAWRNSADDFTRSLTSPPTTSGIQGADQPQMLKVQGQWLVRDRAGRVWDEQSLTMAIKLRRGFAETVDPLIKQVEDLPDFIADMGENQQDVKGAVTRLLSRMHEKNLEIKDKAEADPEFGFNLTKVTRRLDGIHGLADRAVADAFGGDLWYQQTRDDLISVTGGKQAMLAVLEFSGIVILCIFCSPLAIAVGIATAGYHYAEASERKEVYQSLIDPELVLQYAQVEADLFAARLGLLLSFLPLGFEVGGVARQAFRLFATEGVTVAEAVATAGREAVVESAEQVAANLLTVVERGLAQELVRQGAVALLVTKVLETSLKPVIDGLIQRYGEVGPIGGLDEAIADLIEQERSTMPPTQGGR